ncbi:MAG: TIGR03571 family LLM class oxidoreductase [Pseudomonadota bacterium]
MADRRFGLGFQRTYHQGHLTLGVGVPLETYSSPVPTMHDPVPRIRAVDSGGFAALWCRDVPLLDPSFGDGGQLYDPFVWLGYVAAHTERVALGTGSIILPLRNPIDLAKAAASVDRLTEGRLILGVASGDRPVEYGVYEVPFEPRGERFRAVLPVLRAATHRPSGWEDTHAAHSHRVELLPKSHAGDIPLIVTGHSRQPLAWIAEHGDGWLTYPRPIAQQATAFAQWQRALEDTESPWKPFSQSLYIDLCRDPDTPPSPIHLGYRLGLAALLKHLDGLRRIGVNHVAFNLRFSSEPIDWVLETLATQVVPEFPSG